MKSGGIHDCVPMFVQIQLCFSFVPSQETQENAVNIPTQIKKSVSRDGSEAP